ncbi:MAG: RnfABCDGE type electron transport complex subunit B [Clostridia bacterium]|nr:RnfABCDGE type electron transport complex subunit B [Clostridia bacterium]
MELTDILFPALWFAALGALFGLVLAIAARVFAVKTDPRVPALQEALPGANCGGCGFSGCAAYAEAIAKGEADVNRCNAGGAAVAAALAAVMGVEAGEIVEKRAVVKCTATKSQATIKYNYEGAQDCASAARLGGGNRLCEMGCIGLGTCVEACKFGAIKVEDGVARISPDLCTGCGACANVCPKHIIELVPRKNGYYVGCSSTENPKLTRTACTLGCFSCRLCEKNCPAGAITVTDSLAHINYDLCTNCGKCATVCPRHIIHAPKN